MRPKVQFWQEYGFGNVEFRNVRLLDSGIYSVLERLQDPEKSVVVQNPGRTLLHVGESVFLVRYDDPTGFENAKTEFPHDTIIRKDGSIFPRYFGEFEKDGVKYLILDCEEKLAPAEEEWIPGTYRNMAYDLRTDSGKVSFGVKWKVERLVKKE